MWRCGIGCFLFSFSTLFVSLAVKSSWYFPGSRTETSRFGLLSLCALKRLSDGRHFCGDFNLFLLALSLTCCVEKCTFPPPGSITLQQGKCVPRGGSAGWHARISANRGRIKCYLIGVTSVGSLLNSHSLRRAQRQEADLRSISCDKRDFTPWLM